MFPSGWGRTIKERTTLPLRHKTGTLLAEGSGGGGVGAYYRKGNLGGAYFGRHLGQYWGKFNCHMCFHLVALITHYAVNI